MFLPNRWCSLDAKNNAGRDDPPLVPPHLPLGPTPAGRPIGRLIRTYPTHENTILYSRSLAGIFSNPNLYPILLAGFMVTFLTGFEVGRPSQWAPLLTTTIIASIYALVWRPAILRNLTVTLTNTHLRLKFSNKQRFTIDVPRSKISRVELKQGPGLRRYRLRTVRVWVRPKTTSFWTWLLGGRIDLIGLHEPGDLRRRLLEEKTGEPPLPKPTGLPGATAEQPQPRWTRLR